MRACRLSPRPPAWYASGLPSDPMLPLLSSRQMRAHAESCDAERPAPPPPSPPLSCIWSPSSQLGGREKAWLKDRQSTEPRQDGDGKPVSPCGGSSNDGSPVACTMNGAASTSSRCAGESRLSLAAPIVLFVLLLGARVPAAP